MGPPGRRELPERPHLARARGPARHGRRHAVLADHPGGPSRRRRGEPGALYDATEIDEILSLRTAALTDREKREARGTDARAAGVIDLVEDMPEAVRERLHGAIRGLREITGEDGADEPLPAAPDIGLSLPQGPGHPWWDPAQDAGAAEVPAAVVIDGETVRAGSRVRLTPAPGAPTPRTPSSTAGAPRSRPWSVTSTGRRISPSSWTTIPAPTCAGPRAASSTSSPTKWHR